MATLEERIDAFISHYASQFYDPVKAHKYYLDNRELKGRTAAKLNTDEKKEAFTYAKSQIDTAEKTDVKNADADRAAQVEQVRAAAEVKRGEIRDKLQKIMDKLAADKKVKIDAISADVKKQMDAVNAKVKADLADVAAKQKDQLEKLANQVKLKLSAVPSVPKGLDAETTARLLAERTATLDGIRNDGFDAQDVIRNTANTAKDSIRDKASEAKDAIRDKGSEDKAAVSGETTAQKKTERDSSSTEREQVAAEAKKSVDSARENYESLKADLKAKYDDASNKEFDAIDTNLDGPAPSKSPVAKKASSKKASSAKKPTKATGVYISK